MPVRKSVIKLKIHPLEGNGPVSMCSKLYSALTNHNGERKTDRDKSEWERERETMCACVRERDTVCACVREREK